MTRREDGFCWDVPEEAVGRTVDADGISLPNEDSGCRKAEVMSAEYATMPREDPG